MGLVEVQPIWVSRQKGPVDHLVACCSNLIMLGYFGTINTLSSIMDRDRVQCGGEPMSPDKQVYQVNLRSETDDLVVNITDFSGKYCTFGGTLTTNHDAILALVDQVRSRL